MPDLIYSPSGSVGYYIYDATKEWEDFKIRSKESSGWLQLDVNKDTDAERLYSGKVLEIKDFIDGQSVEPPFSSENSIYRDTYKIHLNVPHDQVEEFWKTIISCMESDSTLRSSIHVIKSSTRTDGKLDGRSHVTLYSMPNLAQFVLDRIVSIFGEWTEKDCEMVECYHVKGVVYYSGGHRDEKLYVVDSIQAILVYMLFQNKSHILWLKQNPLVVADRKQEELDQEVEETAWYQKAQRKRAKREKAERKSQ